MLTSYNGTSITYDAIGNPTKWRNSSSLTWEGRTLIGQTLSNDDSFTYTYNSSGIRTQKKYYDFDYCGYYTYDYVLDGEAILCETAYRDTSKLYTLYYLYDESGVSGFIYNNQYFFFQKNLQGDIVRILNSSGTIVTEYTYDAWGKVLTTTGSLASTVGSYNPFRYRSYYYDVETGFYYLQSRYYDPMIARFLNADGIVGANGGIEGYNMFAYCNNNPIMYADASGNFMRPTTVIINDIGGGGDGDDESSDSKSIQEQNLFDKARGATEPLDGTCTFGLLIASVSVGPFVYSYQLGLACDLDGNIALQETKSDGYGVSNDSLGASAAPYFSYSDAPDVYKLNDAGVAAGVSAGAVVYGLPLYGGYDINLISDKNGGYYNGGTVYFGFGTPGADAHVTTGNTETLWSANVWDFYSLGWEKVKSWFED